MLLFLTFLLALAHPAHATTCPFPPNAPINSELLIRYATDSGRLTAPKLFRTEANPEFYPENPTTYWALPTAGSTIMVKVHRAESEPTATGTIDVIWTDSLLTIDPKSRTLSGADECSALQPATEHMFEILNVVTPMP